MTFIVSIMIGLTVIYLNLLSHEKTQEIYLEQTEMMMVDLKKDFLRDTIHNVFLEIDRLKESKHSDYHKNTEFVLKRFEDELGLTDEGFIRFFQKRFNEDVNPDMWSAFLWDTNTGEILYSTPALDIESITQGQELMESRLSSYLTIEKNNIKGVFGVNKAYIDQQIKKEIEEAIRKRKFSGDSYIWINEIINYEGGDNYAIRRVHPNLEETEGEFLSTSMEDVEGNLPYLEELEGINEDGELFFTYYFKRFNNSLVSQKLTYAKLYKDYDWIIAMGVHMDDINEYTEDIRQEIEHLSSESIRRLLAYNFMVLLIGFAILYWIEQSHRLSSNQCLEEEINLDSLTQAHSRRYGERSLSMYFKKYKKTGESPAIMIFDIDNFKDINDQYGHQVGDLALIEVIDIINRRVRSSDQVIRWGGDEFVCTFPGLKKGYVPEYGEKLLADIAAIEIPIEKETIMLTVSMGFSYFEKTDYDYTDALKRADDAMYHSKKQGKNSINIL